MTTAPPTVDPTASSSTEPASAQKRKPGGWFYLGMVLWTAVFVALYFTWKSRTEQDQTSVDPQNPALVEEDEDGTIIAIKPGTAPEQPDDGDDGRPEPVVIKMTWPDSGVADFKFTASDGSQVTKNDLLGEPWIASFIFTTCRGPCTAVTASVQTLHDRYRDKPVKFVTFTVDPERDTPEVLAQYRKFWANDSDRWLFLTGDKDELYSLINRSFLMPVGPAPKPEPGWEIIHTTNVCLVDPTGRVVGKYLSNSDVELAQLRRDLQRYLDVGALTDGALTSEPASDAEGANQ